MNRKYTMIALLTMTVLLLNICLSNVSPVSAGDWPLPTPREETVALCGYWPDPEWATSVPCIMDWGQVMETYFMYEPMFGMDVAANQLIEWLGESIEWVDSTAIKVTLREGIYWVKITDWDAWQKCTGGVEYYRPITAEDVKYSFYLYGAFDESPDGKYWHMGGFLERVGSMDNFEIVDDRTFIVHIKPEFPWSLVVWRTLISGYLIMPADVWQEIESAFPDWVPDVGNVWTDSAFRSDHPDWLVASGMYLPYKHETVEWPHYALMKKNPLWWGIGVLGRQPAPNYFVNLHFPGNIPIYEYITAGDIDWDGDYVPPDTWIPADYHTYLSDPPYFVDASTKIMVPNYRKWPLGETWLLHAITHVIDFDALNAGSENYCKPPSPLYIPADDEVARRLLNTTIEDYYINEYLTGKYTGIPYKPDLQEAREILDEFCFIHTDGNWYTDDGPSDQWANIYVSGGGADYLQIGTVTKTADDWLATGFGDADELTGVAGINVKLGPWYLSDIVGWTDINAMSELIADAVTKGPDGTSGTDDDLGISLALSLIEYEDYETRMNDLTTEGGATFDFVHFCMHVGLNSEMFERYGQFYNPPAGCYNNMGDLRNSTISDLLDALDKAKPGSPEEQQMANQLQWLVGDDLPYVPTAGHPQWYLYFKGYWHRWPNEKHAFLPVGPYGGSGSVADLQYIILSLGQLVVPMKPGLDPMPTDLNNDCKVNIKDVSLAARAFGSYCGHPRWEFVADIMPEQGDGKVNILDIGRIALDFGATQKM